jgi:hypothetical protein
MTAQLHLFGASVPAGPLYGLQVQLPNACGCGDHVALIGPGTAPHAAELRCRSYVRHRGWLSQEARRFVLELATKFGAPTQPIILRNFKGDHTMTEKKFDNSGILFRNEDKDGERDRDYQGSITVAGVDYWLSAWIKEGKRGKFMSLAVKLKEPAAKPKQSAAEFNDEIPFS